MVLKFLSFFFILSSFTQQAVAANQTFMSTLNIGWPKQLAVLDQETDDGKNYLVIVSLLPEPAIDIESAEAFRRSLIEVAADGDESILGHVMFGWKCNAPSGQLHGMSAMTGELNEQIFKMVNDGWGYTSMMSTFTDGYMQNTKEIEKHEISKKIESGKRLITLGIEVTQQECMSFYNALNAFVTHPNVPMSRFGSMTDPSQFTGGGCISTALNLFSQAAVFPHVDNFKRFVPFKTKFIGRGFSVPNHTELPHESFWKHKKTVSFDTFVWSSWEPMPGEAVLNMHLEDPELLIVFMKTVIGMPTARVYKSIIPDPSGEDEFGVNRRFSWTKYTKDINNNASYLKIHDLAKTWKAQRGGRAVPLRLMNENSVLLRK